MVTLAQTPDIHTKSKYQNASSEYKYNHPYSDLEYASDQQKARPQETYSDKNLI